MKEKGYSNFAYRIAASARAVARKIKQDIKHVPRSKALAVAIVFTIICVVILGLFILSKVYGIINLPEPDTSTEPTTPKPTDDQVARACTSTQDCVPDSCCHAFRCVNKAYGPSCTGIFCTMDCQPGTMDCGQGSCACTNGLCEAYIMNPV